MPRILSDTQYSICGPRRKSVLKTYFMLIIISQGIFWGFWYSKVGKMQKRIKQDTGESRGGHLTCLNVENL